MKTYKSLNQYEIKGLCGLVSENLFNEDADFLDSIVCGISQNNLINLANTEVQIYPKGFKYIGQIGLNIANDIVLNFWDEEGNQDKTFWISYSDLMHQNNPINLLTEIK